MEHLNYSKDLPERFRTWTQFWDMVTESGLHLTHQDVIIEERFYDEEAPNHRTIKVLRFKIETIKDGVLEELLADRMKRDEVLGLIYEMEMSLRERIGNYQPQEHPLFKSFRTAKRILLTISGLDNGN